MRRINAKRFSFQLAGAVSNRDIFEARHVRCLLSESRIMQISRITRRRGALAVENRSYGITQILSYPHTGWDRRSACLFPTLCPL